MGFVKEIPPPYAHQYKAIDFFESLTSGYDASDPGTGKTRSSLEIIARKRQQGAGRAIVFAPKSILKCSWQDDARHFVPHLTTGIAYAKNRMEMFQSKPDIIFTNHDAAKWVSEHSNLLSGIDMCIIDEITAYKHRTSQRSKAMLKISKMFSALKLGLSGTMLPNGVLDIWHQVLLLDGGEHLGTNFWKFRATVCEPIQKGNHPQAIEWVPKPGSEEAIIDILSDMMVRNVLEECVEIPENTVRTVQFDPPPALLKHYEEMRKTAVLQVQENYVNAVHAASLRTKLLQIASGAVYDGAKNAAKLSDARYELIMDLIEERKQCVIAFNWKHQKEGLIHAAEKRGFSFRVIDGEASTDARNTAVTLFQAGEIRIIFAHPQSAGHGLTLTKGTTTIWTSPIDNAEFFRQFNGRIYRNGQKEKTETLLVCANNTLEAAVYENLDGKTSTMNNLLFLLGQG